MELIKAAGMSVRNLTTMFRTNKRHYLNIVWWLKMSYYKPETMGEIDFAMWEKWWGM